MIIDDAAVLAANDAFYEAFGGGDFDAMETVWSGSDLVMCVHPGWHVLEGHDIVLDSWRAILSAPPPIRHADARCISVGDAAHVICKEIIGETELVATNIFVMENGHWKMVHHHAGQAAQTAPAPAVGTENPGTVH